MIKTALSIFTGLLSCTVLAGSLQRPIDHIINQIDPKINMGMMVIDLNTGETLYQRDVKKLLIPASNMKLFSDATALLALGPDYHFKTQLSTDASKIENGILYGSLYLSLPGDPTFSSADLDQLLSKLQQLKIKQITGSFILVSDFSHASAQPPGIVPKDLNYSYGAPTSPLIIDENRVTVTVNPSSQIGQKALVEYSAPQSSFIVDNQVTTVAGQVSGIGFTTTDDNHLIIHGKIGQNQSAIQDRIPIKNPLKHAEALIRVALKKQGIEFNGPIVLGAQKPSLLLATHHSKPLTQLLADTLKPSDNLYANSLFLHAANKIKGQALDWLQAETVVKQYLQQQTGINMASAVLVDGSGLSRHDLLSAEQTVTLLCYLHERFPVAYEYIAALPIAGQDGTLQRRLRKPTQKGLIRAKTGSMTGITSLSGYLYAANGHTLAFAIYINTRPGTSPNVSGRYRSMIETICDFLLKQKPENLKRYVLSKNPQAHVAYQYQPSDAEKQHSQVAKWRQIEYVLKQTLKNQPVTIVFRGQQLLIMDNSSHWNTVWSSLQKLSPRYKIAVALESSNSPSPSYNPHLLWVSGNQAGVNRVWTLHDVIG
ncbi:MAG TPA: D-alanyl-D-alanine carboxypeptidase/D-alanyl-D-alanine-endopeptidase [Legionellaceae bacterium]|nr:D-alanyl-D-alanine carboxypeptidase/D-alanyl-D-alanine-endopeptidase [Legionellaceae bacterium]